MYAAASINISGEPGSEGARVEPPGGGEDEVAPMGTDNSRGLRDSNSYKAHQYSLINGI
jgi:hypothetical protein